MTEIDFAFVISNLIEINCRVKIITQQTFVGLEDVLKILCRQTKYLLGISVYLSGNSKSKCVSNKSVFHKSISDNSKANPKCIN